jgi:nucleoid-associated protein YgaU
LGNLAEGEQLGSNLLHESQGGSENPGHSAREIGVARPEPPIATTTVSRGDSLWRLSRDAYGAGTRYAVIYKANREQIRNPNLIYPGQIFVLPTRP